MKLYMEQKIFSFKEDFNVFDENRNPQKSVSIIKIENGEAKLETKVNP